MAEPNAPNVSVSVGPVIPTAQDGAYLRASQKSAWTDYYVVNRYEKDLHRYMLGVTSSVGVLGEGNSDTVAFVQLAGGTLLWIADWTALRAVQKPLVPRAEEIVVQQSPNSSNRRRWILLDEHIEPGMIDVMADGSSGLYRISGTYFYGLTNPSGRSNLDAAFPVPPYLDPAKFDRTLPDELFQPGILKPQRELIFPNLK